ncbi:MAG TPA: DNA polymerase I [Muribaculum sp.]|jgi:DNA polymerase-1|uniref:DNA polymerase I n=1 Tax=Heminiphilus faecis TaxID=2601703 RepID=UPI000EF5ED1E|nr:DNA polymerase I [Heminiphilus faecis]RLT77217.1 DNA polymerase I [bacterium J10(2018)]HRF68483.1 DNA polymerase I [Muribaculum sp.]
MADNKLFLLDAYALIYRAYYALIRAPRLTAHGFNTSAVFGFVNTLDEVLRRENPTHIAVCFDPPGPTFRHEAYPEYKAQRDKQPEDITMSLPYIKEIVKAYGIPVVEVPGYEADDVIGTLSRKAEQSGLTTYMMTPDKDYGQLVTDNVFIFKPGQRGSDMEICGPKEICDKYGIDTPLQVIDILALEGDAVDNIPGCPGVGQKTASKLISIWGSVENLIKHVDDLKGAVQKKITDNSEQIKFSKFLATIKTDVPVDLDLDALKLGDRDLNTLRKVFTELEFRTFLKKLGPVSGDDENENIKDTAVSKRDGVMPSLFDNIDEAVTTQDASTTSLADVRVSYRELSSVDDVSQFVGEVIKSSCIGVAFYVAGAEAMTASWQGLAVTAETGVARYIAMPVFPDQRRQILDAITPLFTTPSLTVVSHDVKRDIILLRREGIGWTSPYYDISVAHYLLEPEMNHSLPRVALAYLDYKTLEYAEEEPGRRKSAGKIVPGEEIMLFCETADVILRLYGKLSADIAASGLDHLMTDIELPLIKVLADMEWTGVRVDVLVLAELSRKFTARLHEMERRVYELAGGAFNVSSPTQVGSVLFERLKLDPNAKRTKRGAYSTTEEILEKYRDAHPIVELILDIRGMRKLLATYVDALPSLVNPRTGKIHTTYNQTVTATGRISSVSPNLQNIPIRTEEGREIRRAFIADKGDLIMSADYSQIELRVIADISGDEDMIEAFVANADIHQSTAAKIYHVNLPDVTEEQRRRAKTANFGIIYGISAFGLAQRLRIPRYEAKELIDGYFRTYPHIKDYINDAIEKARSEGYVTTIMGRKRMLPDINSRNAVVRGYAERNAVNAPIQGSAADIIKLAMVNIADEFAKTGLKSKMIMQVHDELIFNVVPDELAQVQEIVTRLMSGAYKGRVPLVVSAGTGKNWLEAH